MTAFGAGASGLWALQRVFRGLRTPAPGSARHLFANGRTHEIIRMIDEMREDRRWDHQTMIRMQGEIRELRQIIEQRLQL